MEGTPRNVYCTLRGSAGHGEGRGLGSSLGEARASGWSLVRFPQVAKPWTRKSDLCSFLAEVHFAKGCSDFNFLPTNGFSLKPQKVKLLAGEQKATEVLFTVLDSVGIRTVVFKLMKEVAHRWLI